MRTTTAVVRYVLSNTDVSFQYLYNQLAVSSLPTSKTPAIMATLNGIPPKNIISPAILNHAATPAIASAVNNVSKPNSIVSLFIAF